MSYNVRIEQSKNKVYNHAIATKILTLMDNLRLDKSELSARRWVWELLQNAKDVAHDDIGVSIEINFIDNGNEGLLEFRHNGKPFSIDNLTFLIEQVSTKERRTKENEKVKTTGKFGTGFLTTHLLSQIVEVDGVVKEPDEPYRRFSLLLDRSGRDIGDIIDSVNASLSSIENIDTQPILEQYSPKEINTAFRYKLGKEGIEIAKKGLNDLSISLVFTLAFIPEIKSVTIVNDGIQYELSNVVVELENNFRIYTVIKKSSYADDEIIKIAVLGKNETCIAIQIENIQGQISLSKFDPLTPKLFCDFPLIGTEDFSFPVIINSSSFNLNEPRNGIYITDNSDIKIEENKEIIKDAVDLYSVLLDYASSHNWNNIYLLAKIPPVKEKSWISKKWFESAVVDPIRQKLLRTPIVDTESNKRIPILDGNNNPNVWFPSSSKEDLRDKIWDLANLWIPSRIPRKSDIHAWYKIIWKGCGELTLEVISNSIQKSECLENLKGMISKPIDPIAWLNMYFELVNMDADFLDEIVNDKYRVILNQNGIFKARSNLKIDKDIEEELKNALKILGVDVRDYLIHKRLSTGQIKYYVKKQDDIINEINQIVHEGKNENNGAACGYLVSLFATDEKFPREREEIFKFCRVIYPDTVSIKREIHNWSENIWTEVDKKELQWISDAISESGNVNALTERLKLENKEVTIGWLNRFITFIAQHDYDHLLNHKKSPILPNQNGDFCIKDDLFLDDGEIDETLKDISANLGYDFRDELLEKSIYLDLPQNRTKNQSQVAEVIIRLITPKFAEFPRSETTKHVFKELYLWFGKNRDEAERCFGDLYKSKHRLFDDDEIAENMQKAEEISELMEEFGVKDLSDLKTILQENRTVNLIDQRQRITQETLVSLGVTSLEELEEALMDKNIADQFVHTSTPSIDMFKYVQGLINRSKMNIIEHLKTLPEYDCREIEELATTVIGGIKKEELPIHVVVRPSDNGEVIIYYSSEKDTLDYENAELWIDNGLETPKHLTLGRILKNTGINKIPV